jgi:hypothetical protein
MNKLIKRLRDHPGARVLASMMARCPHGGPKIILDDFLDHQGAFEKSYFFGIAPNVTNQRISRAWEAHVTILDQKNIRRTRRVLGVLN